MFTKKQKCYEIGNYFVFGENGRFPSLLVKNDQVFKIVEY